MRVIGLGCLRNAVPALFAFSALMAMASGDAQAQVIGETVYRIKVTGGLDQVRAQDYMSELESLGFLPVNLDFENDPVSVLYGNFPTREDAVRAKVDLQSEGFIASDILTFTRTLDAPSNGDGAPETYRVLVGAFAEQQEARVVRDALEEKGFLFVESSSSGDGLYLVTVGQYANKNDAQNLRAILNEEGYATAQVIGGGDNDPLKIQARAAREAAEAAAEAAAAEAGPISPLITQSDLWQELSEDQKRRVLDTVLMQDEIRAGDTVAQKLLDLEKRIESLDERSKQVVRLVEEDRDAQRRMTIEVGRLYRDAESLARGGQYTEALVKLRQILQIDPEHQLAQTRIRIVEGFTKGERYEGQEDAIQRSYDYHSAEASRLELSRTLEGYRDAKGHWQQIAALHSSGDPEKPHANLTTAQRKIKKLDGKITDLLAAAPTAAAKSSEEKSAKAPLAIWGVVLLLFVAFVFLLVRSGRQRKEFLMKIHEITSVRPPRELEPAVAGAGSLPSGAAAGLDEPGEGAGGSFGSEESFGDPLAQVSTEKPPAAATAEPPAGADGSVDVPPTMTEEDDVTNPASSGPDSEATADDGFTADDGTESADLDDLFGESSGASDEPAFDAEVTDPFAGSDDGPTEPSAGAAAPEPDPFAAVGELGGENFDDLPSISDTDFPGGDDPVEAPADTGSGSADDFSLGDIFTDSGDGGGEASVGAGAGAAPASTMDDISLETSTPDATDISAISFDDIVAAETGSESAAPPATSGTGSLGEVEASAVETGSQAETSISDDPFAGTPFEELMGEGEAKAGETAESPPLTVPSDDAPPAPSSADETSSINLDFSENDPFESVPSAAAGAAAGAAVAGTAPRPSGPEEPTAIPPSEAGSVIFVQDFSRETVGGRPSGWEGEYAYASLTVKSDDPPRGVKNYVAYEKSEGAGKAYFSMKFPDTSGVLSVEFDLRCNDKNKFLLGFYIEKDEDFQQSVHTKILRSETQTAPTIHLHGEPAPYMLGTWAHIRYVIDLTHGTVDGYIDSTHIARSLRLPQSPKCLNTLAIRDNINTTGQFWIANIKIEKIG